MVGTAVKRFQTGEQVISQSFPLGQHPPHLNTPGEENVPTVQVPAECVHEGKMHLFFPFRKRNLPFFYPLQSLLIFCVLRIRQKSQLPSNVPAQHYSDCETWSPHVPTAVSWSPDGEHCTSTFNSAL